MHGAQNKVRETHLEPSIRVVQSWFAEFRDRAAGLSPIKHRIYLSVVSQATQQKELRPTRELDACDTTI